MKTIHEAVDVVIAGGGTAGHIAAIQAARAGVKTSVIEAGSMLAGTMTAGGVNMPNHFYSTMGPVVLGIPWELYSKSKEIEGLPIPDYTKRRPVESPGYYSYINVPIYVAVAEEEAVKAGVIIHYHEFISEVNAVGDFWEITSLGRGIQRITKAREIIDATGDSDVVRILNLIFQKIRKPQNGVHGRTNLVAHAGQKLALGSGGLLGDLARGFQVVVETGVVYGSRNLGYVLLNGVDFLVRQRERLLRVCKPDCSDDLVLNPQRV